MLKHTRRFSTFDGRIWACFEHSVLFKVKGLELCWKKKKSEIPPLFLPFKKEKKKRTPLFQQQIQTEKKKRKEKRLLPFLFPFSHSLKNSHSIKNDYEQTSRTFSNEKIPRQNPEGSWTIKEISTQEKGVKRPRKKKKKLFTGKWLAFRLIPSKISTERWCIFEIFYVSNHSIPSFLLRNPTTSFSTTAILAYAIGAGITAAAGTRLALQLFLVKRFKLFSFQLQSLYFKRPALLFLVTASLY